MAERGIATCSTQMAAISKSSRKGKYGTKRSYQPWARLVGAVIWAPHPLRQIQENRQRNIVSDSATANSVVHLRLDWLRATLFRPLN